MQWKELYDKAAEKLAPRAVSPFIEAGGVAAAILTAAGNVYTGVCIDTACTLGMCAERSAIANMHYHRGGLSQPGSQNGTGKIARGNFPRLRL